MSDFAELLKSLDAVAAEQNNDAAPGGDDDNTIAAAAADSGVSTGNPEDDEAGAGDDAKPVAKSMTATGADGETVEVVDATEMLKSLQAGQAELGETLTKALTSLAGIAKAQGETIKSLRAEVKELAGQGRGRKAVLAITEKPDATMAKGNLEQKPAGLKPQEVMAKCLAAQRAGTMTGLDVARAEIAINNGVAIPADVMARIQ